MLMGSVIFMLTSGYVKMMRQCFLVMLCRRSARLAGHAAGDVTPSSSTHQHQQQQPAGSQKQDQQQQQQRQPTQQQQQQWQRDQQQEQDLQTPVGMDADTPGGEAGCSEIRGMEYEGSYGGSMMGNGVLLTPVLEGGSQDQQQEQQQQEQQQQEQQQHGVVAGGAWSAAWPPEQLDVSTPPLGPEVMSEVRRGPFPVSQWGWSTPDCNLLLELMANLPTTSCLFLYWSSVVLLWVMDMQGMTFSCCKVAMTAFSLLPCVD